MSYSRGTVAGSATLGEHPGRSHGRGAVGISGPSAILPTAVITHIRPTPSPIESMMTTFYVGGFPVHSCCVPGEKGGPTVGSVMSTEPAPVLLVTVSVTGVHPNA